MGLLRQPPLAATQQLPPEQRVDQGVGLGDRIAAELGAGSDVAGRETRERPRRLGKRGGDAREVVAVVRGPEISRHVPRVLATVGHALGDGIVSRGVLHSMTLGDDCPQVQTMAPAGPGG